jgi:hypothetical protein
VSTCRMPPSGLSRRELLGAALALPLVRAWPPRNGAQGPYTDAKHYKIPTPAHSARLLEGTGV